MLLATYYMFSFGLINLHLHQSHIEGIEVSQLDEGNGTLFHQNEWYSWSPSFDFQFDYLTCV